MKKYLVLTTIAILLGCVVPPKTSSGPDASAEEYAVLSTAIADMFDGERVTRAKILRLAIQDVPETEVRTTDKLDNDARYFGELFPTLAEGVAMDYRIRNKDPLRFKDLFDLNMKYVLVSKQEIEKIFKEGGGWWDEFYKRYPDSGGLIALSRPGFNPAMNQAIVYISHNCNALCGTGHYVLLEKSADRWKVVEQKMVWIS